MQVTVRLFAMMRDAAGVDHLPVDLPDQSTAGDALVAVVQQQPALQPYAQRLAIAVNLEYVPWNHALRDGDEVALIPPVSGG